MNVITFNKELGKYEASEPNELTDTSGEFKVLVKDVAIYGWGPVRAYLTEVSSGLVEKVEDVAFEVEAETNLPDESYTYRWKLTHTPVVEGENPFDKLDRELAVEGDFDA